MADPVPLRYRMATIFEDIHHRHAERMKQVTRDAKMNNFMYTEQFPVFAQIMFSYSNCLRFKNHLNSQPNNEQYE